MCVKFPFGDLNHGPCLLHPTLHKYLYLWSDYHTNSAWWYPKDNLGGIKNTRLNCKVHS